VLEQNVPMPRIEDQGPASDRPRGRFGERDQQRPPAQPAYPPRAVRPPSEPQREILADDPAEPAMDMPPSGQSGERPPMADQQPGTERPNRGRRRRRRGRRHRPPESGGPGGAGPSGSGPPHPTGGQE
jgi:hypothetical protein